MNRGRSSPSLELYICVEFSIPLKRIKIIINIKVRVSLDLIFFKAIKSFKTTRHVFEKFLTNILMGFSSLVFDGERGRENTQSMSKITDVQKFELCYNVLYLRDLFLYKGEKPSLWKKQFSELQIS